MKAKKPEENDVEHLVIETTDNFILILNGFIHKTREINCLNSFLLLDVITLRKRIAALEKAELDRQDEETK